MNIYIYIQYISTYVPSIHIATPHDPQSMASGVVKPHIFCLHAGQQISRTQPGYNPKRFGQCIGI